MTKEHFKISSGLKQIIGKELITDKFVAIFELVKNAFDARATKVTVRFNNIKSDNATISIVDNGEGMSKNDILNKWLFVAYSEKKKRGDYRDNVSPSRLYAGSKGIGRFSCDILGKNLKLVSKAKVGKAHQVSVAWNDFEKDQDKLFSQIPIELSEAGPSSMIDGESGTTIVISNIPQGEWTREDLLNLRKKMEKLIRPDLNLGIQDKNSKFQIMLEAPEEAEEDKRQENETNKVNGKIKNFVFDELNVKTTKIVCSISKNGKEMKTTLTDRGAMVYDILEHNPFNLLKETTITLYFLNRSAKMTFKKMVGVESIKYGNIFVYKNGFRIYPFGERGDDTLGVDNRAMQGYKRYMGLRNLVGQIDIRGENLDLKESTSRDAGLVKTKTYSQLAADLAFRKNSMLLLTLKRLEKYVVEVTQWGVTKEAFAFSNDRESIVRFVNAIASDYDGSKIISIDYDKNIIDKLVVKENSAEETLSGLKFVAHKTKEKPLQKKLAKAIRALEKLVADQRNTAQLLNREAETNQQLTTKLEHQERENLFVKSSIAVDSKEFQSIQHHINRSTAQNIPLYIKQLSEAIEKNASKEEMFRLVGNIDLENKKIIALSGFVTKAKFDTMTSYIKKDIVQYIEQYVQNVYNPYRRLLANKREVKVSIKNPDNLSREIKFRPIEVAIIFDNLLNNSHKAGARQIDLIWKKPKDKHIQLVVKDDGKGIRQEFVGKVFDFRFSTTDGAGLGLYHVKEIMEKMGGAIKIDKNASKGASFTLEFAK